MIITGHLIIHFFDRTAPETMDPQELNSITKSGTKCLFCTALLRQINYGVEICMNA